MSTPTPRMSSLPGSSGWRQAGTRIAMVLALVLGAACAGCLSMMMPAVKPLPRAITRDSMLEQAAMQAVSATGIQADPLCARIVSGFRVEQNELTGEPTKRYVDIAVAVRSRTMDNNCTWGTYRFWQRHAGGGTYDDVLRKEILLDRGSIDCKSPELVQ